MAFEAEYQKQSRNLENVKAKKQENLEDDFLKEDTTTGRKKNDLSADDPKLHLTGMIPTASQVKVLVDRAERKGKQEMAAENLKRYSPIGLKAALKLSRIGNPIGVSC